MELDRSWFMMNHIAVLRMDSWSVVMLECSDVVFTTLLVVVQTLGLAGVIGVRASEGTRFFGLFQLFYFLAFALVGAAIMFCLARASHSWLCCVVTLTVMSVGAIYESNRTAHFRRMTQSL